MGIGRPASKRELARALGVACLLATSACTPAPNPEQVWRMPLAVGPVTTQANGLPPRPPQPSAGGGGLGRPRGDLPEGIELPSDTAFWVYRERAAFVAAQRSDRGVMIDFYADWCVPCRLMDRDTFSDPETRIDLVGKYVPLRVDVTEDSRSTRDQMMRFRVDFLPAVLFLDANGAEQARLDHYLPPNQFQGLIAELPGGAPAPGPAQGPAQGPAPEPTPGPTPAPTPGAAAQ